MITNPAVPSLGGCTGENAAVCYLGKLLPALVSLLLVLGAVIFIFVFLTGAIKWITAGGDKAKLEEAKQTLSNALLGVVILFSFFGILSLVECFFGIGIRTINVGLFSISFGNIPACN